MNICKEWKRGRRKSFCCIITMVAFVAFLLLWSMWHKSTEVYVSRPFMSIDSLYMEVAMKTSVVNSKLTQRDITDGDRLKYKLDSIDVALKTLNNTILVLEKQTELRQDDIRQETNNVINKFNGNIEWWIFLLGIICGVAPILLTFLNHQKDAEYIELLHSNYEKMATEIERKDEALQEKIDELDKVKNNLNQADNKRTLEWENKQKELHLVFSFMYIASFTRKAKFQVSADRDLVVEKLMKTITDASLTYLNFESSEPMKDRDMDLSFWILSALEGMELLRPFIDNDKVSRQLDEVLKSLHHLRDRYYNGETFKHDDSDIASLKGKMEILRVKKWG